MRYSSLDLFQRHGYFLTSSINCSRDITQNIHNTQLNSIERISELMQRTTNNVLPAACDRMGSTAHARPQRRFKNIATNQTTLRRSYIANIAYIAYAVLCGPLRLMTYLLQFDWAHPFSSKDNPLAFMRKRSYPFSSTTSRCNIPFGPRLVTE